MTEIWKEAIVLTFQWPFYNKSYNSLQENFTGRMLISDT